MSYMELSTEMYYVTCYERNETYVLVRCPWPHLGQVGNGVQSQGSEDAEERLHDRLVVRHHGWVPQRPHEGIDGNGGVVLLAAGHQASGRQQLVSTLLLHHHRTCA